MKKNYRVYAALALSVLALSACGKEKAEEVSDETVATETETAETQTKEPAEEAPEEPVNPFASLKTATLLDLDVESLVTLGEYKGITIEMEKTKVTDDDIENAVNNAFMSAPFMREVTDRAIEEGDTANIDFVGKYAENLEEFEGGAGEGYDLTIGSHSFIDGFEDGLIGVKTGETVDLNLTFPEDYMAENLAGVDVIFTVTVNSIKVADEEPTDEWAEGLGVEGVTDLESFKDYERGELEADAEEEFIYNVQNAALDKVVEDAEVSETPEELVNRYSQVVYDSVIGYLQSMAVYGIDMTVEDYVSSVMQDNGIEGEPMDYIVDIAKTQAERLIVLQAIANKEGIEVSEEDLENYIQGFYYMYYAQSYENYDEFRDMIDTEDYREQIMTEKVADFIVENANIVEK